MIGREMVLEQQASCNKQAFSYNNFCKSAGLGNGLNQHNKQKENSDFGYSITKYMQEGKGKKKKEEKRNTCLAITLLCSRIKPTGYKSKKGSYKCIGIQSAQLYSC